MTDVRCRSKKHAALIEDELLEVKCDSRFCGAGPDRTVLHRFNTKTGELVETQLFKNPRKD